jgi:hypothetical protein
LLEKEKKKRQIKREELKREDPNKLKDLLEKEKKKRQIKREQLKREDPDKFKENQRLYKKQYREKLSEEQKEKLKQQTKSYREKLKKNQSNEYEDQDVLNERTTSQKERFNNYLKKRKERRTSLIESNRNVVLKRPEKLICEEEYNRIQLEHDILKYQRSDKDIYRDALKEYFSVNFFCHNCCAVCERDIQKSKCDFEEIDEVLEVSNKYITSSFNIIIQYINYISLYRA